MNRYDKENASDRERINAYIKGTRLKYLYSFVALIVFSTLGLILSAPIMRALEDIVPFTLSFIQVSPDEILINSLKVALLVGIYLSAPIIAYQMLKPKVDAMNVKDRKAFFLYIVGGFLMSAIGILFALYVLIPSLLYIFLGVNMGIADIALSISSYVSFCLGAIVISVLLFEIPVLVKLTSRPGFIEPERLIITRKQALLSAFILSFIVLTPPELLSILIYTGIILAIYKLTMSLLRVFNK